VCEEGPSLALAARPDLFAPIHTQTSASGKGGSHPKMEPRLGSCFSGARRRLPCLRLGRAPRQRDLLLRSGWRRRKRRHVRGAQPQAWSLALSDFEDPWPGRSFPITAWPS
jgi:hypothetical protein